MKASMIRGKDLRLRRLCAICTVSHAVNNEKLCVNCKAIYDINEEWVQSLIQSEDEWHSSERKARRYTKPLYQGQ
jgi:hypothetical protein